MSKSTWIPLAVIAALILVATAAFAVTRIADTQPTAETMPNTEPADSVINGDTDFLLLDPSTAAESAISAMFAWEPVLNDDTATSALRSPAITDDFKEKLTRTPDDARVSLPKEWQGWKRSGDVLHAITTALETTGTDTQQTVTVDVDQGVLHESGERTPYSKFIAEAEMKKTGEIWQMDAYKITELSY